MSNQPDSTEFDTYAGDYDTALAQGISVSGEDKNYFARGRIAWLSELLRQLNEQPASIMDFGCGTGSSTPFFLEWPSITSLLGIDVSPKSLDVAIAQHASGRTRFRLMNEYDPAGDLDLVFCNGVFHHIPLCERPAAVQYIYHSLRPRGLFALWENNPWNPGTRFVMSRIPFDGDAITLSPPTARRLARSGGFQILRTDFLFIFPRILKFLRPLERLAVKLPFGAQYLVLAMKPPG